MSLDLKEEYNDYIRLFISDIRRAGPGVGLDDDLIEKEVLEDMRSQEIWYRNLKPYKSLLKFRLPYIENRNVEKTKLKYLDGDIYFQIWPPGSSSETRLCVAENAAQKEYDCVKYENQMFRFNTIDRVQCYFHDVDIPGLDHCYDCRAEVFVLKEYLKHKNQIAELCKPNQKVREINSVEEYIVKDLYAIRFVSLS